MLLMMIGLLVLIGIIYGAVWGFALLCERVG
jgi:hypothetical protein